MEIAPLMTPCPKKLPGTSLTCWQLAPFGLNFPNNRSLLIIHLFPEMQAVTRFRPVEWMDLTIILVHLCPGMQVEMKMADSNISNYQHLSNSNVSAHVCLYASENQLLLTISSKKIAFKETIYYLQYLGTFLFLSSSYPAYCHHHHLLLPQARFGSYLKWR